MRGSSPVWALVLATVLVVMSAAVVPAAADGDVPELAVEHKCGFEHLQQYHNVTPTGVVLKERDPATGGLVYESISRSSSGGYEPIRIGVFFEDLDDTSKYCTTAGGTAPDFQGDRVSCSADEVLTAEKKTLLKERLIPEALQLHADRLRVQPLDSPIVVEQSSTGICAQFTIPASHLTTGVSGYDFVIYVAAGPTGGNTIAWATACNFLTNANEDILRPIVGVTNISPKYISTAHATVRVVAHEILHALGFSSTFFSASGTASTATVRRKTGVPVITSPKVVNAAKDHYGCDSLTNMEIEDGGGEGTAGSHWKRRNAKDELMAGISSHGYYTALTIAMMEDLGYYQGDYSKAEVMPWGLNAGCKLLTDMCMSGGRSIDESMFCTDGDYVCTSDRSAVGVCNIASSVSAPSWASGYGLFSDEDTMDYCPYVVEYSGADCAAGNIAYIPNSRFGDGSRCLDVDSDGAVCAAITCSDSTYTVQFATGSAVTCSPGDSVTIPGTSRRAQCPPYIEVCDKLCPENCSPDGALSVMATHCVGVLLVLAGVLATLLM